MAKRRSKKLLEADKFRATVMALRQCADVNWTPYEDKWLESEARRSDDYIHSDDERKILNQLIAAAKLFSHYAEYSVVELIRMTFPYRFEHDLPDQEFLEGHYRNGTSALPVRSIRYLAALYRRRESLQRDEEVEAVFRQTWAADTSLRDYEDNDWLQITYLGAA
jgi:hypothetical protein